MKMKFFSLGLLLLIAIFLPSSLRAEKESDAEESSKQTILMDESLIIGVELGTISGRQKRIPGPALSTALRWEGVAVDELDIPKEILEHLSQSDLSFFKNRENADDLNDDMRSDHDE